MQTKNISIGFWRRLAAQWIDVFVIYSITKFIILLIALPDLRISFEILFIITGAIYSTVMLSSQRQTVGKMLLQIAITSRTKENINLRQILLREVFGKWGITILLPVMLGRIWAGGSWLPTVFDILMLLPIILLCMIYYLITKQMWYEHLAGLTLKRKLMPETVKIGFYVLMIVAILGFATGLTEYSIKGRLQSRLAAFQNMNSTKPYVKFLEKQNTNPVDYIIGLFNKYDVVVLCERAHLEMKQWDFIYDIISDPRFVNKSGHVFTELGQLGMQDYMNKFMLTDSLSEREVHNRVIHIMRNMGVWPEWTKFNLYNYFKRLYYLNQTLPPQKRIQHYFTDAELDWSSITTKEEYDEYWNNNVRNRDEIMARTVIEKMAGLLETKKEQPKALVIMNYRHAMDLTDRLPSVKRENTYEFIKDSFGDHAANVLINSRIASSIPIASGIWDDAFDKTGNKPKGFNFQGSPFGACFFELFPFNILFRPFSNIPSANGSLRYRDVFTGFVFTHPTKDQFFEPNIPGYFDGFEDEYIRRAACISDEYVEEAVLKIQSLKQGYIETIANPFDYKIETKIEFVVYCFSAIGLLIGLALFLFRPIKMKQKILIDDITKQHITKNKRH